MAMLMMVSYSVLLIVLAHAITQCVAGEATCSAKCGVYTFELGAWDVAVIQDGLLVNH